MIAPRLHGFPSRGAYQSLACGAGASWICSALGGGGTAIAATWAVVAAGVSMLLVARPWLDAGSTRLVFDEGGVRLRTRTGDRYLPYRRGGEAKFVAADLLSAARLELQVSGKDERIVVQVHAPLGKYDAEELVRRYNYRSRSVHEALPETGVELPRAQQSVEAWCEGLAKTAAKLRTGGYRNAAPEANLKRVFLDRRFPEDARAAAAYCLLSLASPERDLVRTRLGPASPPLVLALCRRAPGGEEVVREADLVAALPFVEQADRP
ncbi:MAG TPA: hypothetical protein VGM56_24085 [Byssovorax sp.]